MRGVATFAGQRPPTPLPNFAPQFSMDRSAVRALALPCVVAALAGPAGAAEELFQARAEGQPVVLAAGERSTWVEEGGARASVELPVGAWVNRVEALEDGWVAGGSRTFGERRELFLIGRRGERTAEIAPPPSEGMANRHGAVPLVDAGRLVGAAWLEGEAPSSLSVRAAAGDETGWSRIETVSPSSLGSQLALSGSVLDDGRWLLVWSLYDGEDSETFWSLRGYDGAWTEPAHLNPPNSVHDIAPAVVATATGALAAWSELDGRDYRLRLFSFRGGEWIDSGYRGGRGSLYPSFLRSGSGAVLLYRTVELRGWTALELGEDGAPRRRALVANESRGRPVVDHVDGELVLRPLSPAAGGVFETVWDRLP